MVQNDDTAGTDHAGKEHFASVQADSAAVDTTDAVHETNSSSKTVKKRGNKWDDVSRQEWHENKKVKTNVDSATLDEPRRPKRKVACLVGYCGTGYHGMQLNPPERTIEGTLFEAFVKVGAVSSDNADDPKKVSFLRAARTDKGVHAAVNVISLKMIIEDTDVVAKINAQLPEQIRVWSILRTIKSFNPRTSCDSRVYEYLLPTAAFLPPSTEFKVSQRIQDKNSANILKDNAFSFWTDALNSQEALKQSDEYLAIRDTDKEVGVLALDSTIPEEDKPRMYADMRRAKLLKQNLAERKKAYRISDERLAVLCKALALYHGTRNFHNYTVGQTFKQPNSKRVIRSFIPGKPFLIDGTEWISLKVHGQSFMLHQIRKMVAMVIMVIRYSSPLSLLESSYGDVKMNIPKAPSLGLLLERPIFDVYNKKAMETPDRGGIELGEKNDEIEDFKKKHLYDKIYAEEESEAVFYNFLSSLDAYASLGDYGHLFGEQSTVSEADKRRMMADGKNDFGNEESTLKGADIEE